MSALWLLALLLPTAVAALLVVAPLRPVVLAMAPWTIPPVFGLALYAPPPLYLDDVLFGVVLGVDLSGEILLLLVALLWWLAGLQAQATLARDPAAPRFFAFFLLSFVGSAGLIMAQDAVSFYAFFTLMSFAAYGLILHRGDAQAREAGRIYLILALLGEAVLLAGVLMAVAAAGEAGFAALRAAVATAPERDLIVALIAVGFGIKVGVIPLHVWLPLAHPAAPAPASAVLSGTIIKAGLLGWLRFLPIGETALPGWGAAFVAFGLLAAFYGVAVGLAQRELKVVLAYSSISQMGFVTVGVGLALLHPAQAEIILWAILIYALHHGFAKGALFMGVSVISPLPRARLARVAVVAGVALAGLALAGAPLTSGALAKALLKAAVADNHLDAVLALAAMGTTLLMARFLWLVLHKPHGQAAAPGVWVPWLGTLALMAGVAWVVAVYGRAPLAAPGPLGAGWDALWPVLAGIVVAAFGWRFGGGIRWPGVPPGDLLRPAEALLRPLASVSLDVPRRRVQAFGLLLERRTRALVLGNIALVERRLSRWRTPAGLVLVLALVLWWSLGYGGGWLGYSPH
ncbi:NADH/ubiquinone/plastoquinone (complex I) [Ectothiorhodospiraceae bacterium 2226]|nr:NADH/ubiquinone/plastoquinone (complex I) [Ectothiorhodospiraceae bacterium 2226]